LHKRGGGRTNGLIKIPVAQIHSAAQLGKHFALIGGARQHNKILNKAILILSSVMNCMRIFAEVQKSLEPNLRSDEYFPLPLTCAVMSHDATYIFKTL
jgi:hypothetical protein